MDAPVRMKGRMVRWTGWCDHPSMLARVGEWSICDGRRVLTNKVFVSELEEIKSARRIGRQRKREAWRQIWAAWTEACG